ncbi:DUF397 domain-containing protein [Streptomyces sp. G45]|uniref:DUF397 domain-containing protein n=1 Tax=Streptomyces sp. G45 TaxID=3406627 RepID=UPI003C16A876
MTRLTLTTWHRSTYSNDSFNACVEVLGTTAGVHVRDSKDLARPGLALSVRAWSAFVASAATDGPASRQL